MRLRATATRSWAMDATPEGVTLDSVYFGPDSDGLGAVQVATASSSQPPARSTLRQLFTARQGKTAITLVVAVAHGGETHLFGPDPQMQPVVLPSELAERHLQSVLDEPDLLAAIDRLSSLRKALDSTTSGFSNSGLFATHHLQVSLPKRQDWAALGQRGCTLLNERGQGLIRSLGFTATQATSGASLLSDRGGESRAVAVLLQETELFDAKSSRFQLSPVAYGLAVAAQHEVSWLLVLRKDKIRLYPGKDGVGVGAKGQTDTFFEVDLATIDRDWAGILPLVFSADALAPDGSTDQLLADSARFATELGARLRDRIYEDVVPDLAVAVAQEMSRGVASLDADGLSTAYRVTLHLLFRLLFQAYAEDRGLLPAGRNEAFDAHSLKTMGRLLMEQPDASLGDAPVLWRGLETVWAAIDHGEPLWQVPAYNGGLFVNDPARSPEGAHLASIELPDSVLGPALRALLVDNTAEGDLGLVDFRSLSVREFGTIYEGLLESSLSLAPQDLTVDGKGAWVPAKQGDTVHAAAGTVYFHSASGERKATGSYFTPKIIVDHLIERSIVPALRRHLEGIAAHLQAGDAAAANRAFFDFRVADLAMGSGHFLVAAIDKIEAMMRDFLTEHNVLGVTEELLRLAAVAKTALGADEVAKSEVEEVALLRRQIARRCIYGLDINDMAVELTRLALWIHTFVPGLPMSSLDHGLVCANSLTGIGTVDEALDALVPDRAPGASTFFDDVILDSLASAKTLLIDLAAASEASKAEIDAGVRLLADAKAAAKTASGIFDVAVAARLGEVDGRAILDEASLRTAIVSPKVAETAKSLRPAHMPVLFPEVFLRENPGFDVLLGNPPWEKVKVEEWHWWGLRVPGLRSMTQKAKRETLDSIQVSRKDLCAEYAASLAQAALYRAALVRGPFPDIGKGGDPDLYQAFAWRAWRLVRADGLTAQVLPRMALSASSLQQWRREILCEGAFTDVCFLLNNQNWVFPEVHPQYTISLTVIERSDKHVIRWCGTFASESEFRLGSGQLAEVPVDEFLGWNSTISIPLTDGARSTEVLRRMKQSPRFVEQRLGWEFRMIRELDATNDRQLFNFEPRRETGMIPIFAGASFEIWEPDFSAPFAFGDPAELRRELSRRFAKGASFTRSAYLGLSLPAGSIPMDYPRVAYRWVTRATDTRTMRACLIPPGVAATNAAPILVRRQGDERAEAFLLGVLCSIPFDWLARLSVELNFTFEILNDLNVPLYGEGSVLCIRVVEISGRLAAVDRRYDDWAAEVGVPVGSVKTQAEKDDLIAELDGLVSLLYGLSEEQVAHVFATFHRGWDYQSRLDAVLSHYREWRPRA